MNACGERKLEPGDRAREGANRMNLLWGAGMTAWLYLFYFDWSLSGEITKDSIRHLLAVARQGARGLKSFRRETYSLSVPTKLVWVRKTSRHVISLDDGRVHRKSQIWECLIDWTNLPVTSTWNIPQQAQGISLWSPAEHYLKCCGTLEGRGLSGGSGSVEAGPRGFSSPESLPAQTLLLRIHTIWPSTSCSCLSAPTAPHQHHNGLFHLEQ